MTLPLKCRTGLTRTAALALSMVAAVSAFGAGSAFVDSSAEAVHFHQGPATLVLQRAPWRVELRGVAGTQYAEAAAPEFKVRDKWSAIVKVRDVQPTGAMSARVQAELADGTPVSVDVSAAGPAGFRLVGRVLTAAGAAADVQAVRGATSLAMVEEVYGFGEMWNGHVAQRGQAFELWDRGGTPDECAYMPYYVSTRNYALFLNYGGRVRFDAGQRRADVLAYEATAHEWDVTLVSGTSIASTVRNFLSVVGMPQRPPRWAYKPWFWLMGDPNHPGAKIDTLRDHHFLEMVDRLDALSIPVGVTWFEPPWQTARTTFVPNPEFSRDLPGLVRKLADRGVRTLAWTVPYTTPAASNWREAVERGFLAAKPGAAAGGKAVKITQSGELAPGNHYNAIDYYHPEAVRWWQDQIARSLETGIRGFKLDAGQDLEVDARLHGGRVGADVHNAYALEYNRTFFEVLKQKLGDDFLMIPRAAWVGSSAYTNFKWPGDLSGSFANNGLPSSVYSSLSLAFCGLPFVSTDIGGFDDQPAPELPWLRWAQFGAMLPGMQTLHMPWWYSEKAQRHFRFLTWLHTDLTPLWATLANEAAATGAPVCRPLVWTYQDDVDCWRVDDEYTVGDALLVAPMMNGNPERDVYLPQGVWHDFWDDRQTVVGPKRVHWFKGWTAVDKFPLYVREGTIIPLEVTNATSGFGWAESKGYVTLAIWPSVAGASEFTLHDTEGPVRITVERRDGALAIRWDATRRNHLLRIHLERRPGRVSAGSDLTEFASLEAFRAGADGWFFDAAAHKLWVRRHNSGAAGVVQVALATSSE